MKETYTIKETTGQEFNYLLEFQCGEQLEANLHMDFERDIEEHKEDKCLFKDIATTMRCANIELLLTAHNNNEWLVDMFGSNLSQTKYILKIMIGKIIKDNQ